MSPAKGTRWLEEYSKIPSFQELKWVQIVCNMYSLCVYIYIHTHTHLVHIAKTYAV